MKEEIKVILGQRIGARLYLSDNEKRLIIEAYLSGNETRQSLFKRHAGYSEEHGKISKWMCQLGIEDKFKENTSLVIMPKRKKDIELGSDEFETLQLKKLIEELEK